MCVCVFECIKSDVFFEASQLAIAKQASKNERMNQSVCVRYLVDVDSSEMMLFLSFSPFLVIAVAE